MRLSVAAILGTALLAGGAHADTLTVTLTDLSMTIGTTPVACAPADASRRTLFIENPGSGNVGYCVGATCAPSIGNPGTSTLQPGQADFWPSGSAPSQPLWCVAANASAPVTIRSGK
jgi:hypothetical protein